MQQGEAALPVAVANREQRAAALGRHSPVAEPSLCRGAVVPDDDDGQCDVLTPEHIAFAQEEEEALEAAMEEADLTGAPVSLGFAEIPDAEYFLESAYFPSKIGGNPAWLHPAGVPGNKNRCPHCGQPLTFLLQVYAESTQHNQFPAVNAFHRTLFLFTCRESACHAKPPPALPAFRVWRSQLPRIQPYYSSTAPNYDRPPPVDAVLCGLGNWPRCVICDAPAAKRCSGCQCAVYCTAEHQKTDWKVVHKLTCAASKTRQLAPPLSLVDQARRRSEWRLREYELVIEDEPPEEKMSVTEKARLTSYQAKPKEEALSADDQSEFEAAVGPGSRPDAADPVLLQFQLRTARANNQVVRYRLGGPPLWAGRQGTEYRPSTSHETGGIELPACNRCGGPRQFEFQVQPQLLHYLGKGDKSGAAAQLEWGVVAVYTCVNSCELGLDLDSPYAEEFIWRQPGHDLQAGRSVFSEGT